MNARDKMMAGCPYVDSPVFSIFFDDMSVSLKGTEFFRSDLEKQMRIQSVE
jgi:hypothetical protein